MKVELKAENNIILVQHMIFSKSGECYIKQGSGLYSGITGELLATTNAMLKFPFGIDKLMTNINPIKLQRLNNTLWEEDGVYFNQDVDFAPIKSFLKEIKPKLSWQKRLKALLLTLRANLMRKVSSKLKKALPIA